MSPEQIADLEIKIAFLERHIEEQDKVMMRLSNAVDALQKEMARISQNQRSQSSGSDAAPADEKPPHY